MNGKEAVKRLAEHGFAVVRSKGSHWMLANGHRKVTVPIHGSADLKIGTLKSIEKQAGVKLR